MQVLGSTSGLFGHHTANLKEVQASSWFFCSRCPLLPGHEFLFVCVSYLALEEEVGMCRWCSVSWPPSGLLFARCDWGDITQKHPAQLLKHQEGSDSQLNILALILFLLAGQTRLGSRFPCSVQPSLEDVWNLRQCPSMLLIRADREQV